MDINDIYSKAWTHFDSVAKQRISTFNFYLIILGALVTASIALTKGPHQKEALVILSACCVLVPFSFFLIDLRICRLLRNLKKPLFDLETFLEWPSVFMPFHTDANEQKGWLHKTSSYTFVFRGIFIIHCGFGLILLYHSYHYSSAAVAKVEPKPLLTQHTRQLPAIQKQPVVPKTKSMFLLPQEQ